MTDVGRRIKHARQALGLSQAQLAKHMAVSQPTVANWEKGSHAPRHGALGRLAVALETPAAWLLGDTQSAAPTQLGHMHAGHTAEIHHVPLINWPDTIESIDRGQILGYVAASTTARRPFAMLVDSPQMLSHFEKDATVIFDRAIDDAREPGWYLTEQSGVIEIQSQSDLPATARILGKAVLTLQSL